MRGSGDGPEVVPPPADTVVEEPVDTLVWTAIADEEGMLKHYSYDADSSQPLEFTGVFSGIPGTIDCADFFLIVDFPDTLILPQEPTRVHFSGEVAPYPHDKLQFNDSREIGIGEYTTYYYLRLTHLKY
ncbi:MAG: hypothetical protein LBD21_10635 [Tannerellaceae bacterium]|jgi:hypothetical protein|nr:hypothetical protein [Tannerellaceae bacterium]